MHPFVFLAWKFKIFLINNITFYADFPQILDIILKSVKHMSQKVYQIIGSIVLLRWHVLQRNDHKDFENKHHQMQVTRNSC